MKKVVEIIDPTLPFSEITVDGKVYKMCFTYEALAAAEDAMLAKGHEVNILVPMLRRTFSSVRTLFSVGLYTFHPELDPAVTKLWVTSENLLQVLEAIDSAWSKSMPDSKPADPPQPEE